MTTLCHWWFLISFFFAIHKKDSNSNSSFFFAHANIRYHGHCYLKHRPIVKLVYDPITSSYARDEEYDRIHNNDNRMRFLISSSSFQDETNDAIRVTNEHYLRQLATKSSTTLNGNSIATMKAPHKKDSSLSFSLRNDDDKQQVAYVRECGCLTDDHYPKYRYFCPLEKGVCLIPKCGSKECLWPPTCLNQADTSHTFVRSIWPVVFIMYALLTMVLLCTLPGKFAMLYWLTSIVPSLNHGVVRWMLRRRPEQAKAMIRSWVLRHREQIMEPLDDNDYEDNDQDDQQRQNNDGTDRHGSHENHYQDASMSHGEQDLLRYLHQHGRPSLVLKTRIYKSMTTTATCTTTISEDVIVLQHQDDKKECNDINNEESHVMISTNTETPFHSLDDDLDDDQLALDSCTICFGPLQTGDRVGNLPCHHTFHVDCLKVWLKKRAVCPLCLRTDVVVRRSGTSTTVDASSQSHNTSTITGLNASSNNNNTTTSTLFAHTVSAEEDFERSGAAHPHNAPNV